MEQIPAGFQDTTATHHTETDGDHGRIDNSLHWVMDMVFRDDDCRIRTNHAPANFITLRHIAHNLIRKAPGKDSFRLRRKAAAWDDDFLASLIAA